MVQIEARTLITKSISLTTLNSKDNPKYKPMINSFSVQILKKVNKLSNDKF